MREHVSVYLCTGLRVQRGDIGTVRYKVYTLFLCGGVGRTDVGCTCRAGEVWVGMDKVVSRLSSSIYCVSRRTDGGTRVRMMLMDVVLAVDRVSLLGAGLIVRTAEARAALGRSLGLSPGSGSVGWLGVAWAKLVVGEGTVGAVRKPIGAAL